MFNHNSKLYKLLSIFSFPVFWQPVLFLFFTIEQGLSATQALFLNSIYSISVVLLEVPAGAISDKYSRKLSAAFGFLVKGLGIFALTFVHRYDLLIIFMVISALGQSLISGSIESLMYDTISEVGEQKKKFKILFARSRSILHFAMAIYIIFGGFIGKYNLSLPLQISLVFYVIAAVISMMFIEPKNSTNTKKYLDYVKDGFKLVFSKNGYFKGITLLMLSNFFILGLISVSFWLITPFMNNAGLNIVIIGIITASMRFIKSFGAYLVSIFDDDKDLRTMFIAIIIIVVALLFAAIFYNPISIVIMFMVLYLVQPFYQANNIQLLNDKIGSVDRTTINSIQSMFTRFYEFLVLPIIGLFLDSGHSSFGLLMIATFTLIGILILVKNVKYLD